MMKKRDSPSPKIIRNHTICKTVQIFVTSLFLVDVINEGPQFICLCEKWIIVAIVNKLISIYFTWFVHNFVNHKYNVLLKRNNVCLMRLNTFVCVCFTSIHREDLVYLKQLKCQGTDQRCCAGDVSFLCQVPSLLL